MIISHILLAIFAVFFGLKNLISKKGDKTHKVIGWIWVLLMLYVSISSFWIKELNDGTYSWIHLLSVWVIISLALAIYFIKWCGWRDLTPHVSYSKQAISIPACRFTRLFGPVNAW